jgi:hypothetical protein
MLPAGATMAYGRLLRKLRMGSLLVVTLCSCGLSPAQPGAPQQISSKKLPVAHPDVSAFLPPATVLNKELSVEFQNDGVVDIVLAYASDEAPDVTAGVRVLKYGADSGWAVAFDETDFVTNGAGGTDTITIEKVRSASGRDGVVVILKSSGAGTATEWHILASAGNKIFRLDPTRIRLKVLKDRGYEDMGYNGVTSNGDLVTENLPGYSHGRARCCPDRPSIEVRFKFIGNSIKLDSVKELPFNPMKY